MSGPARRSATGSLWEAIDERYHLSGLVEFLSHKEVPTGGHSTVWYYFGGVSLFFFTVQIVTGILLLMYYQVGGATSYESMKVLVGHVPFGWLVRSIHCWSAHLMCLSLLVHMFSVLFSRSYRKPREVTWFTGCILFGLALGFGFSGYLLPWNELSYFATAVGTDSMKSVPVIGHWLLRVLRGADEVSVQTLYRFFALHVVILPLATAGVIGLHLILVQRQGMAPPIDPPHGDPKPGMPFFPNFALRDVLLWVFCLNLLAILAVLLPYGPGIPGLEWELGSKADLFKPAYPGIKPEWYFLWIYQMLKEFPAHLFGLEGPQVCLLLVNVLLGIAFLVPVLDRTSGRGVKNPVIVDAGVGALLFVGLLTLKAWDLGVPTIPGQDPAANPVQAQVIARTAATWVLAIGLLVTSFRRFGRRHYYFLVSGAAMLQAALHGFLGISWLLSLVIGIGVIAAGTAFRALGGRGGPAGTGGASGASGTAGKAAVILAASLLASTRAHAAAEAPAAAPAAATTTTAAAKKDGGIPEAQWPKEFAALFSAAEKGKAILSEEGKTRFRGLPGHAQELFFAAAKGGLLSSPVQLGTLLALDLDARKVELLLSDNCVLCHTSPDIQSDETIFRPRKDRSGPLGHLDLAEVVADVHFRKGLMCSGCHGGAPTDTDMNDEIAKRWPVRDVRKKERDWIPGFCARCHASSEFMRGYNPKLPVDQLAKFRTSKHGELLLEKKDQKAAQCVACHGVHGIRGPESPLSLVYPARVPYTCGRCHADAAYMAGYLTDDGRPLPTNQLAQFEKSVHGEALLKKHDNGAPACNDCHGNHAALPPETAHVSQVCRVCHKSNGVLFDGSPHKKAFEAHKWPECVTCHGNHGIARPTDDMVGATPRSICTPCHDKYGKPVCNETAEYFRSTIVVLAAEGRTLEKDVHALGERGFDLDELHFRAASVDEGLQKTRRAIHTFDRSDFGSTAAEARKEIDGLKETVAKDWGEYRFRRKGLLFATILISGFGLLLWLKIRQIDGPGGR